MRNQYNVIRWAGLAFFVVSLGYHGSQLFFDPPTSLGPEGQQAITEYVAGRITDARPDALDRALRRAKPTEIVVSISDGTHTAQMHHGAGDSWSDVVDSALESVPDSSQQPVRWIKVDFVQEWLPSLDVNASVHTITATHDRTLTGIRINDVDGAVLPPELSVTQNLIDSKSQLKLNNVVKLLQSSKPAAPVDVRSVTFFRSSAYASIDGTIHKLYRGSRIPSKQPSADELTESLIAARDYLLRELHDDGVYTYAYLPNSDSSKSSYNILRHAGTTWALLQLHELFSDDTSLKSARLALEYLIRNTVDCPRSKVGAKCLLEGGAVKLGANGLALLAFAKLAQLTGERDHLPLMRGYALRMGEVQSPDGEFKHHKDSYPEGADTNFVSGYYPGEAIFGLISLYAIDPDPRWLQIASSAADWLIRVRDKDKAIANLDHDHWLLYGLNEIHQHIPAAHYVEHTKRLVTAILRAQNSGEKFPDYDGSWYNPPRSTPAATRVEGLMAAYRMLVRLGDDAMAQQVLDACRRAIRYQLTTQIWPELAMYLPNPARALGGFRREHSNFEVRIDYVQHNASAMMYYLQASSAQ